MNTENKNNNCGSSENQLFFITEKLKKMNLLSKKFPKDHKIKNKIAKILKRKNNLQNNI